MWTQSPSPIFVPRVLWPSGCMDQDAAWYGGRRRPTRHCVRWGPSSPSIKGAQLPPFSAHICCGQMAAWIKMSLGMELALGAGDFVLDGDLAPPPKGGTAPSPIFGPFYCGQTAGCIKMPLGVEVSLDPSNIVLDGDPALPSPKRGQSPQFSAMSIVAKRLHGSRCHLL